MTTRESEWDPDQQALMLALGLLRHETCDGCGGHLPETTDPENEYGFEAVGPYLCHSCEAIGSARQRYVADNPQVTNPNRWTVQRR